MPRQYLEGMLLFVEITEEESITTGMSLLVVKFKDRHGKIYSWAPKWLDLIHIVEYAKVIEATRKTITDKGIALRSYNIPNSV